MRLFAFLLFSAPALFMLCAPRWAYAEGIAASIVKVRAVDANGSVTFGSAVVVGSDTLATTCHVTRSANTVEVSQGSKHWVAETQVGSLDHDLCMLTVRDLRLPTIPMRRSAKLRLGERVIAAGYPGGGELLLSEGAVQGLYRYDGGRVIRTSAHFDAGASGGGLFDEAGNLVGFLAFKARTGAALHFALPMDWILPESPVGAAFRRIPPTSESRAFWEHAAPSQPPFLRVALLEAAGRWKPLATFAENWQRQEPDNPEAWIAAGMASEMLGLREEAVDAYRRAVQLEPDNIESLSKGSVFEGVCAQPGNPTVVSSARAQTS